MFDMVRNRGLGTLKSLRERNVVMFEAPCIPDIVDEKYVDYFGRFAKHPLEDVRQIEIAYSLTWFIFQGEVRETGDLSVFEHSLAVSCIICDELKVYDTRAAILALIHDSFWEDSFFPRNMAKLLFGQRMDLMGRAVSIPGKHPRSGSTTVAQLAGYYRQAQTGILEDGILSADELWLVRIVMLSDKLHNMRTMKGLPEHKIKRKIAETTQYAYPIIRLLGENDSVHAAYFMDAFQKEINTLQQKKEFSF
jgi:(p)ppGpp synthase/HD superfamily hydrolase